MHSMSFTEKMTKDFFVAMIKSLISHQMKYTFLLRIFIVLLLTTICIDASAQCAMCKTVVETGSKNGSSIGAGLNVGILYLLAVPVLSVGAVSFAFWRKYKASQK